MLPGAREIYNIRVARRLDEVEASVNTVINNFLPVDAVLLLQVGVETGFNVLNNGLPATRQIR